MASFLPRSVFIVLFVLLFSSCALPSVGSIHVAQAELPKKYEKVWGVDIFNVRVECGTDSKELVRRGRYYQVTDLVFEENLPVHQECLTGEREFPEMVIELIQIPEQFFRYYEMTDDRPRILEMIYVMGYRPATLQELLFLGAAYRVPFVVYGKMVAFGSFSKKGEFFYVEREDKGRRILSKPVGRRWREYNVWFVVVKR